ncbi:phosphotransferase [Rothia sp. ZJ1223]|uniref:phosphotransferase n=1 Tax=Rothia sp. ZJ1223 TaxID=2811098 RepID=UPI00195BBEB2|nr:phosphotransferase [Rothia sp. ZJ1223]
MTVTPLQLAAIVSAGVPGLYPVAALPSADDAADFDSAVIIDSAKKRWRVRSPRHPEASVRLEAEHVILQSFSAGLRARLPFEVPTIVGTVPLNGMQTFIYTHIPGTHHDIDELAEFSRHAARADENLATELGKMIAIIHVMPETIIDEADLPVYSATDLQERRIRDVERAEATGKVPSALLKRWKDMVHDDNLWTFRPRVVHGDLSEDNLVLNKKHITEVTGWSEVCVGDPAIDFSWLLACSDQSFSDEVFEVYSRQMPQAPDRNLMLRANLYAEFALAQWLVRGIELDDDSMVTEGVSMLQGLEADLRAAGEIVEEEKLPAFIEDESAPGNDPTITWNPATGAAERKPLTTPSAAELDAPTHPDAPGTSSGGSVRA